MSNFNSVRSGSLALVSLLVIVVGCSAQGQDDRVTAPPGQESAEVTKVIDQAKQALASGKTVSDLLSAPAYQDVRAWPRFRELIKQHAPAVPVRMTSKDEPGEPLHVQGTVTDAGGQPVAGALLYVYHTSSKGWYSDRAAHISGNGGDSDHARLFAYLKTDEQGKYAFHSVRPAGYARTDLPAHIHVAIEAPGKTTLWTEILFDDDAKLTSGQREDAKKAGFLVCPVRKDDHGVHHVEARFRFKN